MVNHEETYNCTSYFNKSVKSSMLLPNACLSFIHLWWILFSLQEYIVSLKVKYISLLVFATANIALKLRSRIEYPWSRENLSLISVELGLYLCYWQGCFSHEGCFQKRTADMGHVNNWLPEQTAEQETGFQYMDTNSDLNTKQHPLGKALYVCQSYTQN